MNSEPLLYVADLKIMKQIMISDFEHFTDFGFFSKYINDLPCNDLGMFSAKGETWKQYRASVTPAFRLKNMKLVSAHLNKNALRIVDIIFGLEKSGAVADFSELTGQYTMDCIGSLVFSMDLDPSVPSNAEFVKMGKGLLEEWRFMLAILAPWLMGKLNISFWGTKSVNFFVKLTKQVMQERSKMTNPPNDILGIMLADRDEKKKQGQVATMTDDMIAQTGMQFFLDGYHTVNSVLKFCFFFLAINQDVQEKALQEVEEFSEKHGNQVNSENIDELKYLDQILKETARFVNLVSSTFRTVTKPWKVPGTEAVLPVGMRVMLPIVGPQMDSEFFPNPEKFDPDRFAPGNKIDPMAFKPWGAGLRQCIGIQITQMESRVFLYQVLKNFKLEPGPETREKLVWSKQELVSVEGGIKLKITSRN